MATVDSLPHSPYRSPEDSLKRKLDSSFGSKNPESKSKQVAEQVLAAQAVEAAAPINPFDPNHKTTKFCEFIEKHCDKWAKLNTQNFRNRSPEENQKCLNKITTLQVRNLPAAGIPEEIVLLKNLFQLELIGLNLDSLPDYIAELPNLSTLLLMGNQFKTLPMFLVRILLCEERTQLKLLREININDNPLEELPFELHSMLLCDIDYRNWKRYKERI